MGATEEVVLEVSVSVSSVSFEEAEQLTKRRELMKYAILFIVYRFDPKFNKKK